MEKKMRYLSMIGVLMVLFINGCTKEHKEEHVLACIVKSVINHSTGDTTVFKKEDAIKNGFEYYFRVYDDGIVTVNSGHDRAEENADIYLLDNNESRSYSLERGDRIDLNMKFKFSKNFDDVRFLILKNKQEYTYDCKIVAKSD